MDSLRLFPPQFLEKKTGVLLDEPGLDQGAHSRLRKRRQGSAGTRARAAGVEPRAEWKSCCKSSSGGNGMLGEVVEVGGEDKWCKGRNLASFFSSFLTRT